MAGFLLHAGATVFCAHTPGQAQPVTTNARVTVGGQPIVTQSDTYSISGCGFPAMSSGAPPCATATWITAAVRVSAGGVPVVLQDSQSTCVPTGTPLQIVTTQVRVRGT